MLKCGFSRALPRAGLKPCGGVEDLPTYPFHPPLPFRSHYETIASRHASSQGPEQQACPRPKGSGMPGMVSYPPSVKHENPKRGGNAPLS